MPELPNPTTKLHVRRPWWRRVMRVILWILLGVVLFHRPLVHYGGRWLAIRLARAENVTLDLRIEGNVWTGLEIHDVRATRLGPGRAPVESLSLDRISARYDLWRLVRGDLGGMRSVDVGTVNVVIAPEDAGKPRSKPPKTVAEVMREVLSKPLPAPTVSIVRADVRMKMAPDDLVVTNFRMAVSPDSPGEIAWDEIRIPGAPIIPAFKAETRFSAGNLVLRDVLAPPDAPLLSMSAAKAVLVLAGNFAGSRTSIRIEPAADGPHLHGEVRIESFDARTFAKQAGVQFPAALTVPEFVLTFDGDPDAPATWTGRLNATAQIAREGSFPDAQIAVQLALQNQVVKVEKLSVDALGVALRAKGDVPLGGAALPTSGALEFETSAVDLAIAAAHLQAPISGKGNGKGVVTLKDGRVMLKFVVDAVGLASGPVTVAKAGIQLEASMPLKAGVSLRDLAATVAVKAEEIDAGGVRVDEVKFDSEIRDLRASVKEFRIARGTGAITASANAALDEKGRLIGMPELRFAVNIPEIADFGIMANGALFSGALEGEGALAIGQPIATSKGRVSLHAKGLKIGDAVAGVFDIEAGVADGEIVASKCLVQLPGRASMEADGRFSLSAPNAFTGRLSVKVPELSAFAPILAIFGEKRSLSGALEFSVDGKGDPVHPEALIKFSAKSVKFDRLEISEARVSGTVGTNAAELTDMFVANDKMRASARVVWKEGRVDVSNLDVRMDGQVVLAGSLSAPFLPHSPVPVPFDQPIHASLVARDLDIAKLLASLGRPESAAGKVSATIEASGTVAKPRLVVDSKADGFKVSGTEKIPLTAIETHAVFDGGRLKITGTVRQPLVKPVTFSAETTVDFQSLLAGNIPVLSAIPLSGSVEMPASPIEFLPRLIPEITRMDGTATVSVKIGGTAAAPTAHGTTRLDIKIARFADASIPVITDFKALIVATGDRIEFSEFGGEAGGGRFRMTGSINVANPAVPVFDLALKSKDVLVLRDDSVLVRAEADVALKGPLNAATVSGSVYVVDSRFNKEIEILPLALPGKPKAVPAAVVRSRKVSFPQPPLRDWTFDVAIKTRADGPFLVRGNLAKGRVSLDLRLAGTGLAPYLVGVATIEQFSAILPLSTLTTRRGILTFSEDAPFEPRVEIEAESKIRQYTVIVRLDGPASKPRMDLESEPPLPQQEILSLLTTGSLSGEIGANNTAMATRAAVLVIKSWYKKIFKKDFPLNNDEGGASLVDRFEVDFGAVDPKTGRNETTAQLRVTDRLYFIGDLQMGGGFSGRVKYLFRFR